MYASAYVNGEWQEKSVHVGVTNGDLTAPPQTKPCKLGIPELDNPVVDSLLKELWRESLPDRPSPERLEGGAFVIKNDDGTYGFVKMTVFDRCNTVIQYPPPPGTVAMIHVHPGDMNKMYMECGPLTEPDGGPPLRGPDGSLLYPTYQGYPSLIDHKIAGLFDKRGVKSFITDQGGFNEYTRIPDGGKRHDRCGY